MMMTMMDMAKILEELIEDFRNELEYAQQPQHKSSNISHTLEQAISSFLLLEEAFLDSLVFDQSLRSNLSNVLETVEREIGFLLWTQQDHEAIMQNRITSLLFRISKYLTEVGVQKKMTQVQGKFQLPLFSRSDSFRHLEYNVEDAIQKIDSINHINKITFHASKEIVKVTTEYKQQAQNVQRVQKVQKQQIPELQKRSPGVKGVSVSAPPPPPMKNKITKRRSEITRLPKVIRLFHSFQSRRTESTSCCVRTMSKKSDSTVADPSAVIDELMSKSKYARQINEELAKYGEVIQSWAEEIKGASFKTMNEVDAFVESMDGNITQCLTDEITIFKRFSNWPVRYDVMREANGKWKQLRSLERELLQWKCDEQSVDLDDQLKRMRDFIDRVDHRLQNYMRSHSSEEMKYAKYEIPWSCEIFDQVKRASLNVLEKYMKLILQSIEGHTLVTLRKRDLLSNCACFAFKIHQMVGGFNTACTEAFTKIERVAQSVIAEFNSISTPLKLKSGKQDFPLLQPACNIANC
eukprot:g428.t1